MVGGQVEGARVKRPRGTLIALAIVLVAVCWVALLLAGGMGQ